MPKKFVPPIETASVSAQKPLHTSDEVGERSFENQMKMVFHEAIGMNLPLGLGAGLRQSLQKTAAVGVVLKDRLPTVAPIHDVIDCAGIFDSELASHDASLRFWPTLSIRNYAFLRD